MDTAEGSSSRRHRTDSVFHTDVHNNQPGEDIRFWRPIKAVQASRILGSFLTPHPMWTTHVLSSFLQADRLTTGDSGQWTAPSSHLSSSLALEVDLALFRFRLALDFCDLVSVLETEGGSQTFRSWSTSNQSNSLSLACVRIALDDLLAVVSIAEVDGKR